MIEFYINFITEAQGEKKIDEPDGFDSSKFTIEQEDKRYGRDVMFAGGESNFGLNNRSNHCFDLVYKYFEVYGFEAEAEFIIRIGSIEKVYDIDFSSMTTDQVNTIQFKAIQKSKEILLKRRSDVSVDLLSTKTLDDADILGCVPENILLKAKPIVGFSEWESGSQGIGSISMVRWNDNLINKQFKIREAINNSQVVKKEGVKNTLTFISPSYALIDTFGGVPNNGLNFTYLEAADDIFDVSIKLSEINGNSFTSRISENNPVHPEYKVNSAKASVKIQVRIGFDIENSSTSVYDLYVKNYSYNSTVPQPSPSVPIPFPANLSLNVPLIKRGQRIWIYVNPDVSANITGGPGDTNGPGFLLSLSMVGMKVSISGTSKSYNTVVPSIRLYDAMKYICRSVSDLEIEAPDYSAGNVLYDQFLLTGNFLRGKTENGFKMNFEELTKGLVETNSDYQIKTNDTVYFGNYKDFYKSTELAVITGVQFDEYSKYFNERYKQNVFKYKYNNYQSQKETEIENTIDVVHGESEWLFKNMNVENKKEVEVSWIRDAFLIEETRKKAYDISDTTATQDDDKKFIIDGVLLNDSDRTFKTTSFLQHILSDGFLLLKNTSVFSFLLLGIRVGDTFTIVSGSQNAGFYIVNEVSGNTLKLQISSANPTFQGEADTEFQYTVKNTTAKYTNWTDEQFTTIENIAGGANFSNLRFTIKRNIMNFYSQYLATANLYRKLFPIKNTLYKNNSDAITTYNGIQLKEGSEFIPENPILTPFEYKTTFIKPMSEYIQLENKIRDEMGFVRFIDNFGIVVRGFIKKSDFTNQIEEQGVLECLIEEKYQPAILSIFSDNITGVVIFNDEISVESNNWSWTMDDLDYLHIFDATGLLLFTKVHFSKVSVNGALRSSRIELEENLSLL